MKKIILLIAILFSQISFAQHEDGKLKAIGEYGIHLFFNEQEFIDVLQIYTYDTKNLHGHMHVPNDFDGETSAITVDGLKIEFDLFVPKNESRPNDLMFHYVGEFFDSSYKQMKGFVTLKGEKDFVASFIGFRRPPTESSKKN